MARHILSALDNILPTHHAWRLKVLQEWPRIIGALKDKVKLHKIENSFVVLYVTHPGLAQELLMLSDLIREKINAVIGSPRITAIHFRTARRSHTPQKTAPKSFTPAAQPPAPLNAREEKILATVENDELRAALSSFYRTCQSRAK
jgi:hypothetical protein